MQRFDQRGLISLITVTFASILISLVTIAAVSQMAGELQQSTQAADHVVAEFAAESGAEDALAYLKDNLANGTVPPNQTCSDTDNVKTLSSISGVVSYPNNIDPAITCRELITSGIAQGTLQENQTAQYDLTNTTALDSGSLEIDWDIADRAAEATRTFPSEPDIDAGNNGGATANPWQGPPALEITVAYKLTADPANPVTKSIYLLPQCTSSSGGTNDCTDQPPTPLPESFNYIWSQNNSAVTTGEVEPASDLVDCEAALASDDYDCKIFMSGDPISSNYLPSVTGTSQYVVRIKALGAAGDYQVIARDCQDPTAGTCNASTNDIPLALTNATIDVTAQVGSAFQRVVVTPPVLSNPLGSTSYALVGTDSICKTLQLINEGPGGYTPQFYPASCGQTDNTNP